MKVRRLISGFKRELDNTPPYLRPDEVILRFTSFILVRQQTIYFFAIHLILDATT